MPSHTTRKTSQGRQPFTAHDCSSSRRRPDLEVCADEVSAIPHDAPAYARGPLPLFAETDPVVGNRKGQRVLVGGKTDNGARGLGVGDDVVEGFLDDTIEVGGN